MPLSDNTVELVKSTVPALQENVNTIVMKFFGTLLNGYPELKSYFDIYVFNNNRHRLVQFIVNILQWDFG